MALLNKYGYGEGTGDVAKKNDDRLTNDETYRNDEVTRTRDVIKNRIASGEDIGTQQNYLQRLVNMGGKENAPNQSRIQTSPSGEFMYNTGMSQDEYMGNQSKLARAGAGKFDSQMSTAKQNVAQLLARNNRALKNVDSQYEGAYRANDQAKFQAAEQLKANLARRGLLGSGIEMGNQIINESQYAQQRMDVDLQKQNQIDQINNTMEEAQVGLDYDLQRTQQERDNFMLQREAEAMQGYDAYEKEAYDRGFNEFNTNRDFDLRDEDQTHRHNMDEKHYELAEKEYLLNVKELDASIDQFNQSLGWEKESHGTEMTYKYATLSEQVRSNQANEGISAGHLAVAKQGLALEAEKYRTGLKNQMSFSGMTPEQSKFFADANNSVDDFLMDMLQNPDKYPGDMSSWVQYAIEGSALSPAMKAQKLDMFMNAYNTDPSKLPKTGDPNKPGVWSKIGNAVSDFTLNAIGLGNNEAIPNQPIQPRDTGVFHGPNVPAQPGDKFYPGLNNYKRPGSYGN